MLDDDHRVARVAQLFETADQPLVVALVQADRRLVEDVEHVDELRPDLRGEADALALAARQRARRTRQRQVTQPHVHQEAQALADLLDDLLGDLPLLFRHLFADRGHPFRKLRDGHGRDLGDILAGDAELQCLLFEARAVADRTFAVDEELVAPLLAAFRIVVLGAADILGDTLPRKELPSARGAELRKIDRQRFGIAVQHGVQRLLGKALDGIVQREIVAAAQHFEDGEEHVVAVLAQRLDGPVAQRKPGVGDDLPDVEHRLLAQSVAMRAGALRGVERKGVGRRVLESHARRGAHQVARIEALLFGAVVVDGHRSLALPHRLFQRGHQPLTGFVVHYQTVHHQVDGVYLVTVETHPGGYFADLAVDAGVDVALLGQRFEQFAVVALAALHHGGHQGDLAPGETREDQIGDLVVGIVDHLLARDGRIGPRRPRIEEAQEVVDLGDGADRRTGILVGGLLLDGHHGAQSRDLVHVGTLHRPHELPGIGRKRLHIAALSLGIDRVEGQRRFARTRKPGDDHQFAARDFEVHVPEVVDPGAEYFDRIFHCPQKTYRRPLLLSARGIRREKCVKIRHLHLKNKSYANNREYRFCRFAALSPSLREGVGVGSDLQTTPKAAKTAVGYGLSYKKVQGFTF